VFEVKDGDRVLRFEGDLLAHSSSHRTDAERWVEFDLYCTRKGKYVVSRVAYSVVYHDIGCQVVRPSRHQPAQVATLTKDSRPCTLCKPQVSVDQAHEVIYPEKPIYYAHVCDGPEGVLAALSKDDNNGGQYYTHVARELIRVASLKDLNLGAAYYVEHVL
jgi:hypothetical protein